MNHPEDITQARRRLINMQTNDVTRRAIETLNYKDAAMAMLAAECAVPERLLYGHYCAGEIQIVERARNIVATIDYDVDVDRWCLFDRDVELTVHETCADAWAAFLAMEDQK